MASYVPLISDEPCVEIEQLPERRRLIEQIAHAVAYSEPPLVVGVHGDWGSGKTSFLHYLQYWLTGECPQNRDCGKLGYREPLPHVVAIWFEAWRYQGEVNPVIALLHEMRGQLAYKSHTLKRLLADAQKYGSIAVESVLMEFDGAILQLAAHLAGAPGMVGEKTGLLSRIMTVGEKRERDSLATALPANKLRHYLEQILQKLLPSKAGDGPVPRLVVFIDDLDRCESEATLRLLEGIKVYLNLPNCVFVLGLNQREVERALARVMPPGAREPKPNPGDLMIRAHEYLEKICANVWHLPRIPQRRQMRLLRVWIGDKLPVNFLATVLRLVHRHDFLPANPRRLKAFGNALLRYYYSRCIIVDGALLSAPAPSEAPMICLIASVQQFHPHLWRHVESEPEFLVELQQYARGTLNKLPGGEGAIRRAKDLHPELAVLELPDEGSVSGSSVTFASRFADRAYGNVLHVQRLLATLDLTLPYIRRYLGR